MLTVYNILHTHGSTHVLKYITTLPLLLCILSSCDIENAHFSFQFVSHDELDWSGSFFVWLGVYTLDKNAKYLLKHHHNRSWPRHHHHHHNGLCIAYAYICHHRNGRNTRYTFSTMQKNVGIHWRQLSNAIKVPCKSANKCQPDVL